MSLLMPSTREDSSADSGLSRLVLRCTVARAKPSVVSSLSFDTCMRSAICSTMAGDIPCLITRTCASGSASKMSKNLASSRNPVGCWTASAGRQAVESCAATMPAESVLLPSLPWLWLLWDKIMPHMSRDRHCLPFPFPFPLHRGLRHGLGLPCPGGLHHALELRQAGAAVGAAAQLALQLGQALAGAAVAVRQCGADGGVGDVLATAHGFDAGGQGQRCLGAGLQQQAAIAVGGQLLLQQGLEPALGAGVAGQHQGLE